MESIHGTCSEDIISRMPKDIISNILDRLPIQDAVKTGILSRNWMYSWTTRSQLVFDQDFFEYLLRKNVQHLFNKENLGSLLLRLKCSITKFVLYIPDKEFAHIGDDIGRWILFLSTKGLKEFVLINNQRNTPLQLPTHLFSCPELKHLKLHNCSLHPVPGFHGIPNLSISEFQMVNFESSNYEEFMARYHLHEILKTSHQKWNGEPNPGEIVKLEKLKIQSLLMCKLDSMAATGSNIFQLMGFLPKLEELHLNYRMLWLLDTRVHVSLPCLKTLQIDGLDFVFTNMVSCAYDFINCSPNLQTLKIKGLYADHRSLHLPKKVEGGIMGKLQLQNVEVGCYRESENEVCFIKSLLANSPLLKNLVISSKKHSSSFCSKVLKLRRASPYAKIHFR